jgi:LysM repeat protein
MPSSRSAILIAIVFALLFPAAVSAEDMVHIVQPGETLYRISVRYGVSMDTIAQANQISNRERILVGQRLTIPDMTNAVENPLIAAEPTHHVVQPGETLASIANRYGLTVSQIAQINNIANPNRILRGQTLTVFTAPQTTAADTAPAAEVDLAARVDEEPQAAAVTTLTQYTVQSGEHLAEIAQRFGVTWPAIVQANNITDPNRIVAGQTIVIPDARTVADLGIITPVQIVANAPAATVTVGKQIIVNLRDQRIYAYEDGRLVRSVLASTGLPATPTVRGSFKVQRKYTSQLMSGPGYYLPNVQWIMYFYAGYAIHGTYWHNNFGQPMSHGCVNLPNDEALWFYEWAPVGTPVLVQA